MKFVVFLVFAFACATLVIAERCADEKDDYKSCLRNEMETAVIDVGKAQLFSEDNSLTNATQPCYQCGRPCTAYCCYAGQYCCTHQGACYCCT